MNIKTLSYPDFVGFLKQKNTPPGGQFTLARTIRLAKISDTSYLLDLACSTGFSSREVAKATGCKGAGIDLSSASIQAAAEEAAKAHLSSHLSYQTCDAQTLPFQNKTFSHVLSGCNFSFIQEREKSLKECHRVLEKTGRLCVANFFYQTKPPEELLDRVERMIGFRPEGHWTRDWWLNFFKSQFKLEIEEIHPLGVQSNEDLQKSISDVIFQNPELASLSDSVKQDCFDRLYQTRSVLNEHRQYQKFNITIWMPHD